MELQKYTFLDKTSRICILRLNIQPHWTFGAGLHLLYAQLSPQLILQTTKWIEE